MQQQTQVVTLQSLVDAEFGLHGEHWARVRFEMALESAKKNSCSTVVGAEQPQRQVPAANSQWELQREQRDAAQRRARRAKQAAKKASEGEGRWVRFISHKISFTQG